MCSVVGEREIKYVRTRRAQQTAAVLKTSRRASANLAANIATSFRLLILCNIASLRVSSSARLGGMPRLAHRPDGCFGESIVALQRGQFSIVPLSGMAARCPPEYQYALQLIKQMDACSCASVQDCTASPMKAILQSSSLDTLVPRCFLPLSAFWWSFGCLPVLATC